MARVLLELRSSVDLPQNSPDALQPSGDAPSVPFWSPDPSISEPSSPVGASPETTPPHAPFARLIDESEAPLSPVARLSVLPRCSSDVTPGSRRSCHVSSYALFPDALGCGPSRALVDRLPGSLCLGASRYSRLFVFLTPDFINITAFTSLPTTYFPFSASPCSLLSLSHF